RVEPCRVLAEFVEDLLHLERRTDRLDQHRRTDGATRHPQLVLRETEDVVPQPGLEVALELGKIKVRPGSPCDQLPCIVEEVQSEIDQAGRNRTTVDPNVLLHEMPTAWPRDDRRGIIAHGVALAGLRREIDVASNRIIEVELTVDDIVPGRGTRVLEVGEPHLRAGIQRVDRHLPVGRPCDLDPAVHQPGRGSRDLPVWVVPYPARLGEEIQRLLAGCECLAPMPANVQQFPTSSGESVVELGDEPERRRGEDLVETITCRTGDLDPIVLAVGHLVLLLWAGPEQVCRPVPFRHQRRNSRVDTPDFRVRTGLPPWSPSERSWSFPGSVRC